MNNIVITKYNNFIFSGLFDDFKLMDCDFAAIEDNSINVGDIYIGYVENIVKGINAAFVRIKPGLNGYYSLDENKKHIFMCSKNSDKLAIGDKILVQVKTEPIKTKPMTLSSAINIVGRYCVAVNDGKTVMVSSKIHDKVLVNEFKEGLQEICEASGLGIVVRTNAGDVALEEVHKEAQLLVNKLSELLEAAKYQTLYSRILGGATSYENFVNDQSIDSINKIITDIPEIYEQLKNSPFHVELYTDDNYPLIKLYSIETQLEKLLHNRVWLDCGGYLIIEGAEALTVIDVNSGKYQGKKSEEGVENYKINYEAAVEIGRQLRLRNLSGIVIIDFINMPSNEQKLKLVSELKRIVKADKVPTTVVDITQLGLVELTRKKVRKPIHEILSRKRLDG